MESDPPSSQWRPLRVWPATLLLILMVAGRYVPRFFSDLPPMLSFGAFLVGPIAGLLILIWWLTASRATWRERLVGGGFVVLLFVIAGLLGDFTMKQAGMIYLTIPMGMAAFAIGAVLFGKRLAFHRTWVILIAAAIGILPSVLMRSSGMEGDGIMTFHWRWSESPEEKMLAARTGSTPPEQAAEGIAAAIANPDWPGFRGPDRTGIYRGPAIDPDWESRPPELLWKIPVGPGWSSFAVAGDFLFTQEQRGPNEAVVCYHSADGREIWSHQIESRFEEALGGPGPRATPTPAAGGVFALGAEGWLVRLDPQTGEAVWQQDLREAASREPPTWGFSSSPLVAGRQVIVHAGGEGDSGVLAFDARSGETIWSAPSGNHSYSSPHLATVNGDELILMASNRGLDLLDPESGAVRLAYEWKIGGYRALQPQLVGESGIILPTDVSAGTRRIELTGNGEQLSATDRWTSRKLKPDFNDFVIHGGHAYGFDSSIFACIDLETGERTWKGGRYGKGQVLLLEKSGLLLVAGERGQVVLLKATPEAHVELAEIQALEGKTWNHPVVVGDRLYIRNGQEAACFRLPLAE